MWICCRLWWALQLAGCGRGERCGDAQGLWLDRQEAESVQKLCCLSSHGQGLLPALRQKVDKAGGWSGWLEVVAGLGFGSS